MGTTSLCRFYCQPTLKIVLCWFCWFCLFYFPSPPTIKAAISQIISARRVRRVGLLVGSVRCICCICCCWNCSLSNSCQPLAGAIVKNIHFQRISSYFSNRVTRHAVFSNGNGTHQRWLEIDRWRRLEKSTAVKTTTTTTVQLKIKKKHGQQIANADWLLTVSVFIFLPQFWHGSSICIDVRSLYGRFE